MRKVVVLRTENLSPSVKSLSLACVDGQPLHYLPGHWINLHLDCGGTVDKRPYSIASAPDPDHPERLEIAVTRVDPGHVSRSLHELKVSDALELEGPFGFFSREGLEQEAALLVGTGTGVSPLRAMIQAELRRDAGPELALLFGCRSREDLLYADEFASLAGLHRRFTFEPSLSRPDPGWLGRSGYVQTQLPELVQRLGRPHVFVCGLSAMVNEVRTVLKQALGYDRKHIHTERYD